MADIYRGIGVVGEIFSDVTKSKLGNKKWEISSLTPFFATLTPLFAILTPQRKANQIGEAFHVFRGARFVSFFAKIQSYGLIVPRYCILLPPT